LLLHEGAIEATGAKNVCRVLDQPGQLVRVGADGVVGPPVNWSELPGNNAVDFDKAFPFVTNVPTIDTHPELDRETILHSAIGPQPERNCVNPHTPEKVRKAAIAPAVVPVRAKPRPVSKQQKTETVYIAPKPKRPKPQRPQRTVDPDDWGNGARGMDIVIGNGFGGHMGGGGGYKGR
jgi:hypothetical protein